MTISNVGVSQKYTLGPVKPWVNNAAYIIGPQFGIKTIYGWRRTDPFPDHPSGHALDFMTPDRATGDALANYVIAHYQALGVKYLIWWHRYWSPATGWQAYTQTTNPHTDHVHVTFLDQPGTATSGPLLYAPASAAVLTGASSGDETCGWKIGGPLGGYCVASNKQIRVIAGIGMLIAGGLIATVGVILLVVYGLGQTRARTFLPYQARRLT
jgi:hypothetical protein